MKLSNCDFIFFIHAISGETRKILNSDWDGCNRNVFIKRVSSKLDSKSSVLCVERPVSPLTTPLFHYSKFKRWMLRKDILRSITDNLFVYLPYTFLQDSLPVDFRYGILINRKLLKYQLMKVMRRCNFTSSRRVVWIYHPFQIDSLGLVDEDIVVYECHDAYTALDEPISEKSKNIIRRKEIELLGRADVVFTTSKILYENKRRYNLNTHYVPNAADVRHFSKAQNPNIEESSKIKGIKKPIIGYFGTIHDRTNVELLTYAADKKPDWSFVLVGPIHFVDRNDEQLKKAKSMPNVFFMGWTDYDELPSVVKAFDVGVIPYKVNSEWNQNVNPTKLHEYTAMGKPVVSTNLPEVQSYRNIIEIAYNDDEFIALIEKALREDNQEKIIQRLKVAERNSWDERINRMMTVIADTIEGKNQKIFTNIKSG